MKKIWSGQEACINVLRRVDCMDTCRVEKYVAVTLRYEMSTHKHLAVMLAVGSDDMVAEVRAQLDKILSSSSFSEAARPSCFLRFVVDKTLSGEADRLKEYVLGVEVFGRKPSFDPRIDPIVRVEAGRLRKR